MRAVQFLSGSLGYIGKRVSGSDRAALLKTVNGGEEWIKLNNGIFTDFYAIYFTSALVGYGGGTTPVGGSTYLLKTLSGDSVWTNQESNMSGLLLTLFFPSTDTGYAAGGFNSAVRTTNGGTDWTVMTPPITGTYNSIFFTSNDTGYIAGQFEQGSLPLIMKTTDAGDSWAEQVQTEVGLLHSIFFVNSNLGFACGRVGLMLKTTSGGVTGISDESQVPIKFKLKQNYPNPFNPTTVISYQLAAHSRVSLKVYDILGNEIATLINEEKHTGTFEVKWDASKFPSGVYFYQLKAGSFIETKKMVLLR